MKIQQAQEVLDKAQHLREWVRRQAGYHGRSYEVHVVPGTKRPTLEGYSWYYTNKSGDVIHYPSAYSKKGFYMEYHGSTHRIEVGMLWLRSKRPRTFTRPTVWDHLLTA